VRNIVPEVFYSTWNYIIVRCARGKGIVKKLLSALAIVLLFLSAFTGLYVVRPVSAVGNLKDGAGTGNLESSLLKGVTGSSTESARANSAFDFPSVNQSSDFAYVDGNKTKLVVGVDSENYAKITQLENIAGRYQARIVNQVSMQGKVRALVFELSLASVASFSQEVRASELATYVEPNMKVQVQYVPDDPFWSMQWGPQKIGADWAWNTTMGDHSNLVAVVDTGIYYIHPDLAANYVALGYDWANNDTDPIDDYGHGTHCAGIIAAVLNNSEGIAGLAQVRVMAEKVIDSSGYGYADWVANGIIHATDCGAKIVSMSIGGWGDSELIHDAVKYAYDAGVLLVAAAGNSASNVKPYPAGYEEVVSVAATDEYDNTAYFSNWGDWIELAAPGVDIYSTVPGGYSSMSGTSMACPHVAGVAALLWSQYPNRTRDWVRMWLRNTADDLGPEGFDDHYGYGRVNARNALEVPPPAHELIAYSWATPPYVKPGTSACVNITVLNFGNDETDVNLQLLANDTVVNSTTIGFLPGQTSVKATLTWSPTAEGSYNITFYVIPVLGETNFENNALSKIIFVGSAVTAVVLHSAGNVIGEIITNWQTLSSEWYLFGDTMIFIDYTSLNKAGITYEDIAATQADVLIISCASDPYSGWQFDDSEIAAITRYVHEGHGLIGTSGTLYNSVPNNNKLAPLFGLDDTIVWGATYTDLMHLQNTTHPIFAGVPNPFVFPSVGTSLPSDGQWTSNELKGGKYLALGHYKESAIVTYRGVIFISPILEMVPPYYHHHLQLFYNAIGWSRYERPQHGLEVSLQCPPHVDPGQSLTVNATVTNIGLNEETDVQLLLLSNDSQLTNLTIPVLPSGESAELTYLWTPPMGTQNVTAYAIPVPSEDDTFDNVESTILRVSYAAVIGFVKTHGESLHNDDLKTLYENLGQIVNDIYSPLTPELLADYDIIIVGEDWNDVPWSPSEIEATNDFIRSGKGFIGIGDELAPSVIQILGEYGIQYTGMFGDYGRSSNFDHSHPIMRGVNYIYASGPVNSLRTTSPAYWIANGISNMYMLIAGAESGGTVLCMSDDFAADLNYEDNKIMFTNVVDWMAAKYDHDLLVTLDAPDSVQPGSVSLLNATVRNRGLNNETNVELCLLINDIILDSTTIPEVPVGSSYELTYLWAPNTEGTYNVTAYAPPMPTENFTVNNVVTKFVKVRYVIARVAVLNSYEIPSYFVGSWSNNYQLLVDALNAQGFYAEAVTNEGIIAGDLGFFDVFVIIDNVPSDAAIPNVVAFWSEGGGLVSFDSSICFLNYAGVLPPESVGSNGYGMYWDYGTSYQAKISIEHPITEGYEVGQIVNGLGGDAQYWADALTGSVSYPYFTTLVEDLGRSDRAYVCAYEPPDLGKVVHIWDSDHWANANLQRMIINSMTWVSRALIPGFRDIAVTSLDVWPTDVYQRWMVYANTTVVNLGNVSTYFDVSLYCDDNLITSKHAGLQPNETLTVNFIWDTSFAAVSHNYTVAAVANAKGEKETGNNRLTLGPVRVRIVGDANADGKVDIFDCILASNAFGASSSEPEYQVFCDVNQDGLIDIFDMIQFAIHFGEGY
jgi:thermitase